MASSTVISMLSSSAIDTLVTGLTDHFSSHPYLPEIDSEELKGFIAEFFGTTPGETADPGEFIIVTDYAKTVAALLGNTKSIKERLNNWKKGPVKSLRYNGKLAFGPGWVVSHAHVPALESHLERAKFKLRKLTREEYEGESKTADNTAGEEIDVPKAGTKAKAAPVTKAPPKAKIAPKVVPAPKGVPKAAPAPKVTPAGVAKPTAKPPVAKDNSFGNKEEEASGFVFLNLPVGTNQKQIPVVVGIQDHASKKKGLNSVIPLDSESEAECQKRNLRCITSQMLGLVRTKPQFKGVYTALQRLVVEPAEADPEVVED